MKINSALEETHERIDLGDIYDYKNVKVVKLLLFTFLKLLISILLYGSL